jgi:hypothetical protein
MHLGGEEGTVEEGLLGEEEEGEGLLGGEEEGEGLLGGGEEGEGLLVFSIECVLFGMFSL